MSDFVVAVALVLVLEGIMFAAFPAMAKRAMVSAMEAPEATLRIVGIVAAVIGVALVWAVRG
jgi:uncharacterized protein YjeT (DUF2065 family)